MNKLLSVIILLFICLQYSSAQMPPPGYERAKKMQEERSKMSRLDLDTIFLTDTILIFDPETYEEETRIVKTKMSIRDYVVWKYGMAEPEMLLDHKPHTIIDPENYEDITIRLTPEYKIVVLPKK